ncbi:MAG: HNH endonuclease signature motif containing protein [Nitrosopumilus sp.]|nr:HNH endonuclease [Nitrososphaerota archaeon]
MGKDEFSQTELLKYLATHKAACNECGKTALEIQLEVNHIDHNKENDAYHNIEILCVNCHRKREGRDTKIRDMV